MITRYLEWAKERGLNDEQAWYISENIFTDEEQLAQDDTERKDMDSRELIDRYNNMFEEMTYHSIREKTKVIDMTRWYNIIEVVSKIGDRYFEFQKRWSDQDVHQYGLDDIDPKIVEEVTYTKTIIDFNNKN